MKCKNGHYLKESEGIWASDGGTMFQYFMNAIMSGTILVIDGTKYCGLCIRERWLEPFRIK